MRVYWSDRFDQAFGGDRRFPHGKYARLRQRLLSEGILDEGMLLRSPLATTAELCAAHTTDYVEAVLSGTLDARALRRIGFSWSSALVERARTSVGGTLAAAREALGTGCSGQLAGGTHHAHADFGSGYCVFNDQAVAARVLLGEGRVQRVAILDLDVHQGDGNSAILGGDPRVFVASVHGERNFPFRKVPGDLDIGLEDGAEDRAYLAACGDALDAVVGFRPDIILYQAGVDALAEDRLGRLSVTHEGLCRRDEMVVGRARSTGVALSIAIGGGYCDPIEPTVVANAQTFRLARLMLG
ncbi:MAG: histone deacetylase [Rhizobiales bacterium]|nr:histone deacetylase [Hyphomicrobiales bacterium]